MSSSFALLDNGGAESRCHLRRPANHTSLALSAFWITYPLSFLSAITFAANPAPSYQFHIVFTLLTRLHKNERAYTLQKHIPKACLRCRNKSAAERLRLPFDSASLPQNWSRLVPCSKTAAFSGLPFSDDPRLLHKHCTS